MFEGTNCPALYGNSPLQDSWPFPERKPDIHSALNQKRGYFAVRFRPLVRITRGMELKWVLTNRRTTARRSRRRAVELGRLLSVREGLLEKVDQQVSSLTWLVR